jgi:GNAT superfamily N-acetyltransferase
MRIFVEPSPSGGYFVRIAGAGAPVSRHDTEEEADAAAAAYRRGVEDNRSGDLQRLRDGGEVLVRAVRPEDKPLFARGWERFGDESRYRRFMVAKSRLTTSELAFFTDIDHIDHEAIGALDPETGEGLAVARYVRDVERPHVAEAAVSVIDAAQGRGLGTLLLRRLCDRAAETGIRVFTAELLASNHSMLHLFEKLGTVRVTGREGAEMCIAVELQVADAPTLELALRTAATGHVRPRIDSGADDEELGRGR